MADSLDSQLDSSYDGADFRVKDFLLASTVPFWGFGALYHGRHSDELPGEDAGGIRGGVILGAGVALAETYLMSKYPVLLAAPAISNAVVAYAMSMRWRCGIE